LGLLTVVAIAAACWGLTRFGYGLWRLRGLRRALPSTPTTSVLYSDLVPVPLTFGWWRPRIVLPAELRQDPQAAALAVAHEAVHVRRADYAVLLTCRLMAALGAFHPLLLLLYRDLDVLSEKACDAAVLSRADVDAAAYARLLLRFADTSPGVPAPALAFGRPVATRSSATLTRRIRAMTATQSPACPKRSLSVALMVALFATALAFVPAHATDAEPAVAEADPTEHQSLTLPTLPPPPADSQTNIQRAPAAQDTPPKPVGGMQAIQQIIRYPQEARQDTLQGTVKITFLVTADGQVSDMAIQQSAAAVLDYEIVRVLLNTDFEPATRNGEPYTADMTFPVTFRLQGGPDSDLEPSDIAYDEEAIETTFTLDQVVVTGIPAR